MQSQRGQAIRLSLLLAICLFAVGREFGHFVPIAPLFGLALPIWAALEWRAMALIAKVTFGAALAVGLWVWAEGALDAELLTKAVTRSAFFAFFLVAMDVLRTAAMSSRMVLESGRMIVAQPPGRRYVMITLGGHIFAILLNLGAINLLGTMTRRSFEDAKEQSLTIREIRLRRMTLALVRGFTAFTMWAPTAVTVFVILSAIPELNWFDFAPMGAGIAAVYMTFGWLLDRFSFPKGRAASTEPVGKVLVALMPMTLLTVTILSAAALLSWAAQIRLIAALLISVPVFGVGWVTVQYARAGFRRAIALGTLRVVRRILPGLTTLRSEVAILSAAGFISVLLPSQIDTETLGLFIADLGLTEPWLLIGLMWFVAITSPIGLNPIVSVAVSVEILHRLAGFSFNPYLLAMAATIAWGLATGISPLGATIRISGRSIDRPPAQVGLVWNRAFSIYILFAASALLIFLH